MNIRKLFELSALLVVMLFAFSFSVSAQVYVSTGGNDFNDGLTTLTAKRTITAGITTQVPGGTVSIAPGFYDETVNLNKRVVLEATSAGAVHVTSLTLAAGNSYSGSALGQTNDANRASIFPTGVNKIVVLSTLTITSGYYVLADAASNLQLANGATVAWNAVTPVGDGRFTQTDLDTEQPLVALGNYDLSFGNTSANTNTVALFGSQLPAAITNLTFANSAALTIPNDAAFTTIGGTLQVTGSGSVTLDKDITVTGAITVNSGTGTVTLAATRTLAAGNNLTNNGRIDGPGLISMQGAAVSSVKRTISGSGTFNAPVIIQVNAQNLGSAVTLAGLLTVNGVDLGLNSNNLTLTGNLTYAAGGSITTGTGSANVIFSGDATQTIDLVNANRAIGNLTINKGPINLLNLQSTGGGTNTLTSSNFSFTAGRLELLGDESLVLSGAASISGVVLDTDGSSTLTVGSASDDISISGNGQINAALLYNAAKNVTFTDLSRTAAITASGTGTLRFNQSVTLTGTLTVSAAGTVNFAGGTSSTSTGAVSITAVSIVNFGAASTTGNLTMNAGTVNYAGGSTINGAVSLDASAGNIAANLNGVAVTGTFDIPSQANAVAVTFGSTTTLSGVRNSSIAGALTIDGTAGAVTIDVDANSASNYHVLSLASFTNPTLNGNDAITVDANAQLKVASDLTLSTAAIAQITINGKISFNGSSPQSVVWGNTDDDDDAISTLEIDNPSTVTLAGVVGAGLEQLTVTNLLLTNGRLITNNTNNAELIILATGSITRTSGRLSIASDTEGITDLTAAGNYSVTYLNTASVTTAGEISAGGTLNRVTVGSSAVNSNVTLAGALGLAPVATTAALTVNAGSTLNNNGFDVTINDFGGNSTVASIAGSIAGAGKLILNLNDGTARTHTLAGNGSMGVVTANISGNTHSLAVSGTPTISTLTANFTTDGVLNLSGAATIANLTTTGGANGTVNVGASGPASMSGNLILNNKALNINRSFTVGGNFTHTAGMITLAVGNIDLFIAGSTYHFTYNNTTTSYSFVGSGRVIFNGSAAQSIILTTDAVIERLGINNVEGVTLSSAGYRIRVYDLVLTAGTFTHGGLLQANDNAGVATGNGKITVIAGSLSGSFSTGAGPYEVVYNTTADKAAGAELSGTMRSVTINAASGTTVTAGSAVTVNTVLNLSSGILAAGSFVTMANGSQVVVANGTASGTFTYPSSGQANVRYVNENDVTTGAELNVTGRIGNVIVEATSGKIVTLGNDATLRGDLTITSGTFNFDDKTLTVEGNVTAGLIASTTGKLKLAGNADKTVGGTFTVLPAVEVAKIQNSSGVWATATFDRSAASSTATVTFNGSFTQTSGNVVFGAQINATISGNFSVAGTARQFDGGSRTFNVSGDYSAAPATRNTSGDAASATVPGMINMGTFVFNGTGVQTISHAQGGSSFPVLANYDFNNLTINNAAGVNLNSNVVVNATATLNNGVITTGAYRLQVDGNASASLNRVGGMVNGTLRRAFAATTAGGWVFPMTDGTNLRQLTITTGAATFGAATNVTVTNRSVAPTGELGLPLTDGSGANALAPMSWVVGFSAASTAGNDPRFTLQGQGLTGFTDIAKLRMVARPGDGEVANSWAIAGVHVGSLYQGGVPTVISDGVGGWSIVTTQEFGIAYPAIPANVFAISGTVTYDNAGSTPLSGVTVTLQPGAKTAVTDGTGSYSFANNENGNYTLSVTTTAAWPSSAVTTADAQQAALHYRTGHLTGMKLIAADVDANGLVSYGDALNIQRRATGLSTSFPAGDWKFQSTAVVVAGANVTANLKGIAVGDANASFTGTAKVASNVSLTANGVMQTNLKDVIEIPVRVSSDMNLGAFMLSLSYDAALAKFEGVSSRSNTLVNSNEEGKAVISWVDFSGEETLALKSNESMITLKFKPTDEFKAGSKFEVSLDGYSELVDKDGQTLSGSLNIASVEGSVPAVFSLKQNYPNPFNPSTTIAYDLPVDGNVTLVVYNLLGEQVATLISGVQNAGSYKLNWNASNLSSGMYIYRINVDAGDQKFTQNHRMMLLK